MYLLIAIWGWKETREYAAMKLTDEQKVHISDSRKQIQQIRASIAEELTWLMDDEQRDKIKSKSGVK